MKPGFRRCFFPQSISETSALFFKGKYLTKVSKTDNEKAVFSVYLENLLICMELYLDYQLPTALTLHGTAMKMLFASYRASPKDQQFIHICIEAGVKRIT